MIPSYEPTIGLEIHAQLKTNSKIFCGCSTKFGNEANTNVCPICLGHPGVLPSLNKKVVEFAVKMGLAVECRINARSIMARKNYFYPDLPKGYQISQYELPICEDGFLLINSESGAERKIRIKRIHIEEDAGKLIHSNNFSKVDMNRCGVPLIEIVTEPDIESPSEAIEFLTKIRRIVQYLDICDANMEEGSLRCDANISIKPLGSLVLGVKTEVKNMNSFKNVGKAIKYEIERQIDIVSEGKTIHQETLLWDADLEEAFSMRSKEDANDYRYFPEPDLMPISISKEWQKSIKEALPELPIAKKQRFIKEYQLPEYDAEILTQSKPLADYYEETVSFSSDYKSCSNWIMTEVLKIINENKAEVSQFPVKPKHLAELINMINDSVINGKIGKAVFADMYAAGKEPGLIIKERNLVQISDVESIKKIVNEILIKNPLQVAEFKGGKDKVLGYFVGQIMKETKGKANPRIINEVLLECLKEV